MSGRPADAASLSVVIIGRNEAGHLQACLESVQALECPDRPVPIIYVDSDSRDHSRDIAAAMGARVIHLTGHPMTAARGRNAGWNAVDTSLVLFLDGDTRIHPLFVKRALVAMTDPATAAVWGHRRESNPRGSVYNRVLDLDWMIAPGWTEFFGGDVLMRRSALASVAGYNPELIAGEEPEMCRRLRGKGWRILHIDAPMTQHDLRMTHFSQYWRRALRAGHAYAQVSGLFQDTMDPFWSAEARRNRIRGLLLLVLLALATIGLVLGQWAAPIVLLLLITGAAVRSAWKVRAKSSSRVTLLLFGLHSHLQEIPIFLGQVRYRIARARRRQMTLIEYKRA